VPGNQGRITIVRQADWAVVWSEAAERHVYARECDIAFQGGKLVHVGPQYIAPEGVQVEEIDGRRLMAIPGLIDVHSHPTSEPFLRGLTEERKSRQFFMSTLYEYIQLVGRSPKTATLAEAAEGAVDNHLQHDEDARRAAARLAVWEMLKSGVTTFVDYSPMRPDWIDDVEGIGIRCCFAPSFRSGTWYTPNGREVLYEWDVAAGERAFAEAMDFLDEVRARDGGLFLALIAPGQIDTCTPELIRAAHAAAESRDLPMTIHAAQSVVEFREMMRRHGMTPIAWLESLGALDPRMIVSHAIFIDAHSWIRWPDHEDLDRIAAAQASVAHCPNQFARGGVTLEYFALYRRAGINMAIGTDTHPHNMLDEMRWAAVLAKVAARDVDGASAESVFEAATVGGARALRCDDIGRLAPGCRADLALIDLDHPMMQPARDPLRSLLFSAQDRAVRHVFVEGRQLVRDGAVLTIDVEEAIETLCRGQARALPQVAARDWAGRSAQEAFPLALPMQTSSPATQN